MNEKLLQQILEKLSSIESTQQEHTQLLRVLEHRSEVTSATVISMNEAISHTEGRIPSLEKATLAIKEEVELSHKETSNNWKHLKRRAK